MSNEDMFQGYCDGSDPTAPPPGENRSPAYHHGFQNARDDLAGKPRAAAAVLRRRAAEIRAAEAAPFDAGVLT